MLKLLAILTVLLAAQNTVPRNRSQQQQHPQSHANTAQPKTPPATRPEIDKSDASATHEYAYYKTEAEQYLKAAFAPAYLSNWVLAGLGIIGGILALYTLFAIKRQANLQTAAMSQWIDVEVVGSEYADIPFDPLHALTIKVNFKAVNNTPFPLTLRKIVTKISLFPEWKTYEVEEEVILPPSRHDRESFHPFFVPVDLNDTEARHYVEPGCLCSVSGKVYFDGAVERNKVQQWDYLLLCKPNHAGELPYSGKEPNEHKENG